MKILKSTIKEALKRRILKDLNSTIETVEGNDFEKEDKVKLKNIHPAVKGKVKNANEDDFDIEWDDKSETKKVKKDRLDKIKEQADTHPGMSTFKKISKENSRINKKADKESGLKLKNYLDIENSSKPEYPHQNNSKTDVNSPMYRNNDEQNEYIADFRGDGMEDIHYQTEPGKEFKDKTEKYIKGDKLTGNSPDAGNAIKTNVGDNIIKKVKRKAKEVDAKPMYLKDKQPVGDNEGSKEVFNKKAKGYVTTENINKDVNKMFHLTEYNEKTQ